MIQQDKKAEIELLDRLVEMESYAFDSERSNREKQLRLLELTTAPSQRILDAGCGPGTYGIILAQCGHEVIGIDISGSATVVAKKRADEKRVNFSPVVGYLEKLPFADDSFDICFCGYTLHHLPNLPVLRNRVVNSYYWSLTVPILRLGSAKNLKIWCRGGCSDWVLIVRMKWFTSPLSIVELWGKRALLISRSILITLEGCRPCLPKPESKPLVILISS